MHVLGVELEVRSAEQHVLGADRGGLQLRESRSVSGMAQAGTALAHAALSRGGVGCPDYWWPASRGQVDRLLDFAPASSYTAPADSGLVDGVLVAVPESTRPIRALMRGLDALAVLNRRDGATVSEVAAEIRLPRTTSLSHPRDTLCASGYVFRDSGGRALPPDHHGADPGRRVRRRGLGQRAGPSRARGPLPGDSSGRCPSRRCRDSPWCCARRRTTAARSPSSATPPACGCRCWPAPSGRVYLAYCTGAQRLTRWSRSSRVPQREEDALARNARGARAHPERGARAGYTSTTLRARRVSDEVSLAVPVNHRGSWPGLPHASASPRAQCR
jgi:hypothetical protein